MITLKDLANTLGVSVSTVSKALKDSPEISQDTIKRVKEIAKELNYRPNTLALSLKNRQTKTLGVIIPDILNPFFANTLYGIEQQANKLGYNIITCISNESFTKENDSINLLSNGSVDGFILSISQETQAKDDLNHLKDLLRQDVPIVMFDRTSQSIECDKVVIDDFMSTFNAVNMFIEEGRKKIILINTLGDLSVAKLRILGYKTALEKSSNTNQEPIIINVDNAKGVREHIKNMCEVHPDVDGVLCIDNKSGLVAVSALNRLNYNIPKDVSIVGFSSEEFSYLSDPVLSTVTQHGEEIGAVAVDMLVDRLTGNKKKPVSTTTVDFTIDHRGTTLKKS